MNDQTREKIMIRDWNGSYEIDLWVPSSKTKTAETAKGISTHNRYQALEEDDDAMDMGFIGQEKTL